MARVDGMVLALNLLVLIAIPLVILGWIVLGWLALLRLRALALGETARVLWVLAIVLAPLVGAVAFFVVRPGGEGSASAQESGNPDASLDV